MSRSYQYKNSTSNSQYMISNMEINIPSKSNDSS